MTAEHTSDDTPDPEGYPLEREISNGTQEAKARGMDVEYAFERVCKQTQEMVSESIAQRDAMHALAEAQNTTALRVDAMVSSTQEAVSLCRDGARAMQDEAARLRQEPWRYRMVGRLAAAFERQPIWFAICLGVGGLVAYILGVNFAGVW